MEIEGHNNSHLSSIEDIFKKNCPDIEIKRQHFTVDADKLSLKETRSYLYQVQLQLLVTKSDCCDFVLFSAKAPPTIERTIQWCLCGLVERYQ